MINLKPHDENRPPGLIETDTVIDVGAGIRPMQWFKAKTHICVEPHSEYAMVLLLNNLPVVMIQAPRALELFEKAETVFLLDLLHHLEKDDGVETLRLAQEIATRQIVVREPLKWKEDSTDHWGMGGEFWQTHRSHWSSDDFPGWRIHKSGQGFYALLDL